MPARWAYGPDGAGGDTGPRLPARGGPGRARRHLPGDPVRCRGRVGGCAGGGRPPQRRLVPSRRRRRCDGRRPPRLRPCSAQAARDPGSIPARTSDPQEGGPGIRPDGGREHGRPGDGTLHPLRPDGRLGDRGSGGRLCAPLPVDQPARRLHLGGVDGRPRVLHRASHRRHVVVPGAPRRQRRVRRSHRPGGCPEDHPLQAKLAMAAG